MSLVEGYLPTECRYYIAQDLRTRNRLALSRPWSVEAARTPPRSGANPDASSSHLAETPDELAIAAGKETIDTVAARKKLEKPQEEWLEREGDALSQPDDREAGDSLEVA